MTGGWSFSKGGDERTVRVFISSTFSDFLEERELLASSVFPRLREKYAPRNITVVGVDLRWGLTEDTIGKNGLVDSCVGQVEICYPYFVGLLGGRYGTIVSAEELSSSSILNQHKIKLSSWHEYSITEIEFEIGALQDNNEYALFFMDDRPEINSAEVMRLRSRVDDGQAWSTWHYTNPEEFVERVFSELDKLIEKKFPDGGDTFDPETAAQIATLFRHQASYVAGGKAVEQLLSRAERGEDVFLLGEKGVGKSAALSYCISSLRASGEVDVVYYYCDTGFCSSDDALFSKVLREIEIVCGEISVAEREGAFDLLLACLQNAVLSKPLYIVVDALEQVPSRRNIWKMLRVLSDSNSAVHCIASATEVFGDESDTICLDGLDSEQVEKIVRAHFIEQGREENVELIDSMKDIHALRNPIVLRGVLDELDVVGDFDSLPTQLGSLLSISSVGDLLAQVVRRVQQTASHFGVAESCVTSILAVVSRAHFGATEDEIERIADAPALVWTVFASATRSLLISNNGRFRFSHQLVDAAAISLVDRDGVDLKELASDAVREYSAAPFTAVRLCEKASWAMLSGNATTAARSLLSPGSVRTLLKVDEDGLLNHLSEFQADETELVDALPCLDEVADDGVLTYEVALRLSRAGCLKTCITLAERRAEQGYADGPLALLRARAMYQQGYDYAAALTAFSEAESILIEEGGGGTQAMAALQIQYAIAMKSAGRDQDAIALAESACNIHDTLGDVSHDAAWCRIFLASLKFLYGIPGYSEDFDSGYEMSAKANGSKSYHYARLLCYGWQRNAVSGNLSAADEATAFSADTLLRTAGEGPDYAWAMTNRATVLALLGSGEEARKCITISARINDMVSLSPTGEHVYSLTGRNNMLLLDFLDLVEGADDAGDKLFEPLLSKYRELVRDTEAAHGPSHPYTINVLANQALLEGYPSGCSPDRLSAASSALQEALKGDNPDSLFLDVCCWACEGKDQTARDGLLERTTAFGDDDYVIRRLLGYSSQDGESIEGVLVPKLHLSRCNGAELYLVPFWLFECGEGR